MTKTYAIIVCFLLILGLQDGAKSRELEPARNADPLSSSALGSLSPAPYHLECISEEQCYEYKYDMVPEPGMPTQKGISAQPSLHVPVLYF
ncbi:hypothetical protein ACFX1X_008645 [Malus domestica]